MAPQPDFTAFPPLPGLVVQWAPVNLETLPGSGERLTVAIAAHAEGGDSFVFSTLRDTVARCMYGEHASHVLGFTEIVLASLSDHLKGGGELSHWEPPLRGSARLGPLSTGYGDSVEDVARISAQLASSLSWAKPQPAPVDLANEVNTDPDTDEWARQIRESTIALREDFGPRFLKSISLTPKAPATRIGYLGARLAAQFGRLVPGRGLANSRNHAKAYLTELQILRDHELRTDTAARPHYELLLWTPPPNSMQYSPSQRDDAMGAFKELKGFGDTHALGVESLHTAEAARARILHAEEA